ncbi:MAG: dihydrolipoyl dehydrogenase [Actinomycetaceae bacterium]|nr:dihydrolipoyl dehydrogenase [Actinomycetaceae bacterium]MDU0969584.1 dihydrolipoyl dehydrogenase [Actinomycetaceae bacterium]
MSSTSYDVVVLGAGSGGYATALRSAQLGKKVALIEGDKVGGTCLHHGCIPTKAMLHVAETIDSIKDAEKLGIFANYEGLDLEVVGQYRQNTINQMHKGLTGLIKSRKIDLISGWGRLVDAHTVEVDGKQITGENIVLATGSYSKSLPGLAIEGRVITSEQALQLTWAPRRAAILGGGVIGVEFASVWASMGAEVTIIEGLPHLVNNEDIDVAKSLEKQFKARGIAFKTKTMFKGVTQDNTGVHVETDKGDVIDADLLLVAVGRGPRTQGMGYEEAGVTLDRGFVPVDENLQTSLPGVYAVGDIVPGLQLAHRGFAQGIFLAEKLAGLNPPAIIEANIPRVTFCEPEIASVGLTQAQAEEKYGKDQITTKTFNLAGNGKSQILGAAGLVKLVSVTDGPIVGFHAIGKRMGEQIGEGQLMVNWEAYAEDVAQLIHAHPTQNEAIGEAAMALAGKSLHN